MTTRRPFILFMILGAVLALGWTGNVLATGGFPATGQTTVYRTGDDGDIQAGKALKYKDNGDGTIKDKVTGLVWEKKSDGGGIHDQGNTYTWDEAFDEHVFILNNMCANDETVDCSVNGNADCRNAGVGGRCGFAGKRDWRVPNVKELQSIVNYEVFNPSVSSAFNTTCAGSTVLTGSCTAASGYWSSTTTANGPGSAWGVVFDFGGVDGAGKDVAGHVRAVRGGL